MSGWPKLNLQVWAVDGDGRPDICGYGVVTMPTAPGIYDLECPLWAPEGTSCEHASRYSAFDRGVPCPPACTPFH